MKQPLAFSDRNRVFQAFATLLDYPESKEELSFQLSILSSAFTSDPNISEKLNRLKRWVDNQKLGVLEEAYTGIFDINSLCSPYIGYYLFGEDYKRSLLITGLKEKFRTFNFSEPDGEMPDHLCVILKFLSSLNDYQFYNELINEAVIPSVEKMISEINHTQIDNDDNGKNKSSYMLSIKEFYSSILSILIKFIKSEVKNDQ